MQATIRSTKNLPTYISYIDDPRVTLEMAERFIPIQNDCWEEGEHEFLLNLLKEVHADTETEVLFPINNTQELRERLIEILSWHYGEDYEYFAFRNLLKVAYKVASKNLEHRIAYSDDSCGDYGNRELQLFLSTYRDILVSGSSPVEYFKQGLSIENEDLNFTKDENAHKVLLSKMQGYLTGLLWTASNIGYNLHKKAIANADLICNDISGQKFKGLSLKQNINKNKFLFISKKCKLVEVESFVCVNEPRFVKGTIELDPAFDNDVIIKTQSREITSLMFRKGRFFDKKSFIIDYKGENIKIEFNENTHSAPNSVLEKCKEQL